MNNSFQLQLLLHLKDALNDAGSNTVVSKEVKRGVQIGFLYASGLNHMWNGLIIMCVHNFTVCNLAKIQLLCLSSFLPHHAKKWRCHLTKQLAGIIICFERAKNYYTHKQTRAGQQNQRRVFTILFFGSRGCWSPPQTQEPLPLG